MEEIDVLVFLKYLKNYVRVILLLTSMSLLITVIYDGNFKEKLYTAETTVVLVKGDTEETDNTITQNDIIINQKLIPTYRQIIKSKLILKQVINDLNLDYSYTELSKRIKVEAIQDTEIIKISVSDTNQSNAAIITNKIAQIFNKEIKTIYNIDNVSIIDKAEVPKTISNNTYLKDICIAITCTVFISIGIVFVIFYFDDKLRYSDNIGSELQLPILAKVFKDKQNKDLIVNYKPNAMTSESIRTLRTNIQFSQVDKEVKTVLITSTIPSEGKSFISSNLACSFAQNGKRVLIIDCDLRKGREHNIFKVQNKYGLSNLLLGTVK